MGAEPRQGGRREGKRLEKLGQPPLNFTNDWELWWWAEKQGQGDSRLAA